MIVLELGVAVSIAGEEHIIEEKAENPRTLGDIELNTISYGTKGVTDSEPPLVEVDVLGYIPNGAPGKTRSDPCDRYGGVDVADTVCQGQL